MEIHNRNLRVKVVLLSYHVVHSRLNCHPVTLQMTTAKWTEYVQKREVLVLGIHVPNTTTGREFRGEESRLPQLSKSFDENVGNRPR